MAELSLTAVRSAYGLSEVLHGVSLEVPEGVFGCLLGRNGMGKTTLLRTVTGLMPVTEGTIRFDGRQIEGKHPYDIYKLGLAYVPQGRHIFPHLTVHENLRMGLRRKGVKSRAALRKVLDWFPVLEERLPQKGGTLSGGEQQMLAIARAMAEETSLLLLDEPTEGVQPSIVDDIMDLLKRINLQEGITILLVEQNIDVAMNVASQYHVMEKGVIVESGATDAMDAESVTSRFLAV